MSCAALQKLQRNCFQFVDMPEKHHGNCAGTRAHQTGERVLCPYSERSVNGNVNKLMLILNVPEADYFTEFARHIVKCFTKFRETGIKSGFSCG